MLGLVRLLVILLVALSVIYWCVFRWFEAGARDRLEAEWARDRPPLPRHTHVDIGLRDYRRALHRKLIWVIYVVPVVAVCITVYALNES